MGNRRRWVILCKFGDPSYALFTPPPHSIGRIPMAKSPKLRRMSSQFPLSPPMYITRMSAVGCRNKIVTPPLWIADAVRRHFQQYGRIAEAVRMQYCTLSALILHHPSHSNPVGPLTCALMSAVAVDGDERPPDGGGAGLWLRLHGGLCGAVAPG